MHVETPLAQLLAKLDTLAQEAQSRLAQKPSLEELDKLKVDWLGKKGALTEAMKALGGLSQEERPLAGARANEVRSALSQQLETLQEQLRTEAVNLQLRSERVDVTLPGRRRTLAFEHPVQMVQDEVVAIFERSGFVPELGPEVEHEFYNFDALNIPPNHPSRQMQDTFYVKGPQKVVLRTQTSPVQIRTLLRMKPPIRMVSPGRVFRADYDATHSPMFHQVEGLLVDRDVHMGDLMGVLEILLSQFFGASLKTRLRPSYFPFTEPSAEVDMQCFACMGRDSSACRVCKGTTWVEIAGCGMVDPEVFRAVDLDPEEYRGFAFGMGVERMAMLKYGVDDLRSFYESDHRYISQFARWRQA